MDPVPRAIGSTRDFQIRSFFNRTRFAFRKPFGWSVESRLEAGSHVAEKPARRPLQKCRGEVRELKLARALVQSREQSVGFRRQSKGWIW